MRGKFLEHYRLNSRQSGQIEVSPAPIGMAVHLLGAHAKGRRPIGHAARLLAADIYPLHRAARPLERCHNHGGF